MSLRSKTALVIVAAAIITVSALLFVSQSIFMRGFQAVEDSNATAAVQTLASALSDRIEALQTLNHDWAAWDDTYTFVQDRNEAYVKSNPTDTTFANADLNLIAILDGYGRVVFEKAFDLESGSAIPVEASWAQSLYVNKLLTHTNENDSVCGIVMLPEGPMLVSAQPIITSEGKGPVMGTIMMAQLLDAGVIGNIADKARLPLDVAVANSTGLAPDVSTAAAALSPESPTLVRPMNASRIAAYALVNDIYDRPALVLGTWLPRDIHASAVGQARSFFIALLGMGAVMVALLFIAQGRLVISRVKQVGAFVNHIGSSGDLSGRLTVKGRDELSSLAADVNAMTDALENSGRQLHSKQEEERHLRLTIESVVEGIATTDSAGKILEVNDSKVRLHGYSNKEELTGRNVLDLIAEDDREKARAALRDAADTGKSSRGEYRMLRRDGTTFVGEREAAVLKREDGAVSGFVISTRDVTERKNAADQLAKLAVDLQTLNAELEAKVADRTRQLEQAVADADASNRAKSEFLASMSHELRTPLNAIIGFSQMLQEQFFGNLNEKQMDYVADILDSGQHLLSLINDILDLSKIEAGKMELEMTHVKMAEVVRSSLIMVKEKALAHGISLDVQADAEAAYVEVTGDERRLKQVIFNLLSNAAKFTPDGGHIDLRLTRSGDALSVSVSDSGIGLSAEEQAKLFQPFYQASGGLRDKTPGTGLGLAITKDIIEKHGGRIWVESEGHGKGSKFTFSLPIGGRVAAPNVPAPVAAGTPAVGSDITV